MSNEATTIVTHAGSAPDALSCLSAMVLCKRKGLSQRQAAAAAQCSPQHASGLASLPREPRCESRCRGLFSQSCRSRLLASTGPGVPSGVCRGWRLWHSLVCLLLKLTGLDRFVAASYGAQQQVNRQVEEAIVTYRREENARLARDMPPKAITLAKDETFTGGLCLVAMEPKSNFIVLEQAAHGRDQDTWQALMETGACRV